MFLGFWSFLLCVFRFWGCFSLCVFRFLECFFFFLRIKQVEGGLNDLCGFW